LIPALKKRQRFSRASHFLLQRFLVKPIKQRLLLDILVLHSSSSPPLFHNLASALPRLFLRKQEKEEVQVQEEDEDED
jgi:hypothetical protein